MPTSLVSTGVQFPDSTIQTTAATAGGTITATASGSISSGAPVIINANGTVSSASATVTTTTFPQFNTVVQTAYAYASAPWYRASVVTNNGTIITVNTISASANGFFVRAVRYINGVPVFGSTVINTSWQNGTFIGTIAYDNVNDVVLIAFNGSSSNTRYMTVRATAAGDVVLLQAATDLVVGVTSDAVATTYDSFTGRITGVIRDTMNNVLTGFCGTVNASGVFTFSTQTLYNNVGTVTGYNVSVTTDPATGKVFWAWVGVASSATRNATGGGQLPTSGNTITSISSAVTPFNNGATANDYLGSMVFDTVSGQLLGLFNDTSFGASYVMSASISGTTPTWGSQTGASSAGSNPFYSNLFFRSAINNTLYLFYRDIGRTVTLSGTTVTLGSATTYTGVDSQAQYVYDLSNGVLNFFSRGGSLNTNTTVGISTTITTTLTADNLIGVSSASYTNGQTATINTVGSTKGGYTGLVPGQKYYASPTGTLTRNAYSAAYAGLPISATTLLVKG